MSGPIGHLRAGLGERCRRRSRRGGAQRDPVTRRRRDQLADAGVGDDLAAAHDHQVVGGVLELAHQVAGHQHRPALRGQRPQEAAHPDDALGVHAVERLVQHQHRRIAEQRCRDAEPLAHAQGIAARPVPDHRLQARLGRPPGRPGRRSGPGSGPATAGGRGRCGWAAARPRPAARRRGCSGRRSDAYGTPADQRRALVGASRPRMTRMVVDLPAPLGPTKPVTCPGCDGERHAVQRQRRSEPLAQPALRSLLPRLVFRSADQARFALRRPAVARTGCQPGCHAG